MSHKHRHRRNGTYTTVNQYINVHRPTSRCPTDIDTDGMAPTQQSVNISMFTVQQVDVPQTHTQTEWHLHSDQQSINISTFTVQQVDVPQTQTQTEWHLHRDQQSVNQSIYQCRSLPQPNQNIRLPMSSAACFVTYCLHWVSNRSAGLITRSFQDAF